MPSIYPQVTRAEEVLPIVYRVAESCGLSGWMARPMLDALSVDVLVRLDNSERIWRSLDPQLDSIDIRLNAHEVYLGRQSEHDLEGLIRSQLAPQSRTNKTS